MLTCPSAGIRRPNRRLRMPASSSMTARAAAHGSSRRRRSLLFCLRLGAMPINQANASRCPEDENARGPTPHRRRLVATTAVVGAWNPVQRAAECQVVGGQYASSWAPGRADHLMLRRAAWFIQTARYASTIIIDKPAGAGGSVTAVGSSQGGRFDWLGQRPASWFHDALDPHSISCPPTTGYRILRPCSTMARLFPSVPQRRARCAVGAQMLRGALSSSVQVNPKLASTETLARGDSCDFVLAPCWARAGFLFFNRST